MGSDFLQSLQVFTEFVFKTVGNDLVELAVLDVLLPVQEPVWDLVLTWIRHDSDQLLNL